MTDFKDRIAVIDYGMGNLHSAAKALEHVAPHARVTITADPAELERVDRVVFPGVGAMRDCMAEIRRTGFDEALVKAIAEKPVLAICVGMQALMESSEENGGVDCLGILPGKVEFFGEPLFDEAQFEQGQFEQGQFDKSGPDKSTVEELTGERLKVPHMGWNTVRQTMEHPLWKDIPQDSRFYFVHSYCVKATESVVAGTCEYGRSFAAALQRDNLFAVQFHPEKSHTVGLQLLKNFVNWKGGC